MSSHSLTYSYTHLLTSPDDITLTAGRLADLVVLGTKGLDFKTHRWSEGKVLSPCEIGRWNSCPTSISPTQTQDKQLVFQAKGKPRKQRKTSAVKGDGQEAWLSLPASGIRTEAL